MTHNTNLYTIFVILFFIIPFGGSEVCILSIDVHLYLKKIQLALIILPEIMDKNVFVTHNCRTYMYPMDVYGCYSHDPDSCHDSLPVLLLLWLTSEAFFLQLIYSIIASCSLNKTTQLSLDLSFSSRGWSRGLHCQSANCAEFLAF